MARQSCVPHPSDDPIVIIRKEYLDLCGGNHCTASLLNVFEYWHGVRLAQVQQERARAASDKKYTPNLSLWVFKSISHLEEDLLGLYSDTAISKSVATLVLDGIIERKNNEQNPMDRTRMYRFNPTVVISKLGYASREKEECEPENRPLSLQEITGKEITGSTLDETQKHAFADNPANEPNGTDTSLDDTDPEDQIEVFMANSSRRNDGPKLNFRGKGKAYLVEKLREKDSPGYRRGWLNFIGFYNSRSREIKDPVAYFMASVERFTVEPKGEVVQGFTTAPLPMVVTAPVVEFIAEPIRDYIAEWNAAVPAAPFTPGPRNGHAAGLRECVRSHPDFAESFAEVCETAQKVHEIRGDDVGWLTFSWVVKRGKDGGEPGWWRLLHELRWMAVKSKPKTKHENDMDEVRKLYEAAN